MRFTIYSSPFFSQGINTIPLGRYFLTPIPNSSTFFTLALNISRQYVHRVLLDLKEEKLITKVGIAPKVYYSPVEVSKSSSNEIISYEKHKNLFSYEMAEIVF